jgi:hypothetical protein
VITTVVLERETRERRELWRSQPLEFMATAAPSHRLERDVRRVSSW